MVGNPRKRERVGVARVARVGAVHLPGLGERGQRPVGDRRE